MLFKTLMKIYPKTELSCLAYRQTK